MPNKIPGFFTVPQITISDEFRPMKAQCGLTWAEIIKLGLRAGCKLKSLEANKQGEAH